jgi:hypothetical protein
MKRKEIIKTIKNYLEGKIEVSELIRIYYQEEAFKVFCSNYMTDVVKFMHGNFNNYIENCDINNVRDKFELFTLFSDYFASLKIKAKRADKYGEELDEFNKAYPKWFNNDAMEYVIKNIEPTIEKDKPKEEQYKILKQKIKETFLYEKVPPRFIQDGEWPMDKNNKPLVFRSQKEVCEEVFYTFVNPDTGEEVITKDLY